MLNTWIINITDDIKSDKWISLLNYVDSDRRKSIEKFRFNNDKKRSLIAGLLINTMMRELYPKNKSEISYFKNLYGKPYINVYPRIYFNISHSGNYVCCAMSDSEIGIDVEEIQKSMEFTTFKNLFTEDEWEQILNEENDSHETFFSLWTLKESYIKKIGKGLSKDLNSFSILLGEQIKVVDYEIKNTDERFLLKSIDPSHKMAICSEKCFENVEKEMTILDFIKKYY